MFDICLFTLMRLNKLFFKEKWEYMREDIVLEQLQYTRRELGVGGVDRVQITNVWVRLFALSVYQPIDLLVHATLRAILPRLNQILVLYRFARLQYAAYFGR